MLNLTQWSEQLNWVVNASRTQLPTTLSILAAFWGFHLLNVLLKYQINVLGIWPRHISGLIGIFFAPLLHGNTTHLVFNSISLFVLLNLMLIYGLPVFISVSIYIILVAGLATWLMGRNAMHIGSSALVLGYWGFLLLQVYYTPSVLSIFVAIICVYHLGGLLTALIPTDPKTSWEGHVFGFIAGISAAFLLKQGWLPLLQNI